MNIKLSLLNTGSPAQSPITGDLSFIASLKLKALVLNEPPEQ